MNNLFKYRNRGLIGTIVFHVIILMLIMFWGFSTPLPLPSEEGILINFGTDEFGAGSEEPEYSAEQVPEVEKSEKAETVKETVKETDTEEKNILEQDFEEAPTIDKNIKDKEPEQNNDKKEIKEEEKTKIEEKPKEIDKKALFPGQNKSNKSESEGITDGNGNQGGKDGSVNSDNYADGNSKGQGGISYSLVGRNPESLPKPEYPNNEQGKVVVEVTVDRAGNVIAANPGVKGSTTNDFSLLKAAKKAALSAKFDRKPDAPAFQKGKITYHFVLE